MDRVVSYRPSIQKPNGYYIYPQSATTTIAGFRNRHRPVVLPEYDRGKFKSLVELRKFVRHPGKWTRTEYANSYADPGKRKFYMDVVNAMEHEGRTVSARVVPFTKLEKMGANKYKAPRLIQARDASFNIEYGRYIKPLERQLKDHVVFGKGNYDQVARRVAKLSSQYKYYTECDHTTFDAHVTVDMLRLLHRYYATCYNDDRELALLSRRTITNYCTTRNGEHYVVHGTRMSGDVDTSFGNSLINYHVLRAGLREQKIRGEVLVNGDDSIIFSDAPIDIVATPFSSNDSLRSQWKG